MNTPYRFDDSNTERSSANQLLANLGIGQAEISARTVAARGDKSKGLVGIGDSGVPSGNPMQIDGPLPTYTQPNPPPAATAAVPPRDFNPMKVSASPNYIQPNTGNPKANPGGTVTRKNPMGL
jgi:hypothetical protein